MDKKFIGLISLLLVVTSILLVLTLSALYGSGKSPIYNAARTLIRAKEESIPSADKSLVFCFPLQTMADGKSKSEVTIFVRSASEKNLSNQKVELMSSVGQVQAPGGNFSDKSGKVSFVLTSKTPGAAQIVATVADSINLSTRCTINFQ